MSASQGGAARQRVRPIRDNLAAHDHPCSSFQSAPEPRPTKMGFDRAVSPFAPSLHRSDRLLAGELGQELIMSERMREHREIMFDRILMRLLANRCGAIFQRYHIVA
jgi:hypothetical protein